MEGEPLCLALFRSVDSRGSEAALVASAASAVVAQANAEPTVLNAEQRTRDKMLEPKAAIFGAYPNIQPSFSPDKKRVLFLSTRSGTTQAWVSWTESPSDPPIAVTSGAEGVGWADFSRDGRYILFTRDEGHDANFSIYRTNLDGTDTVNLTPGEKLLRNPPERPIKQSDTILYAARESSHPSTRFYLQKVTGRPGARHNSRACAGLDVDQRIAPQIHRFLLRRRTVDAIVEVGSR